jgi:hypothetical protein
MRTWLAGLSLILAVALLGACGGAEGEEQDDESTSGPSEAVGAEAVLSQDVTATPEASATPEATASPTATPSPTPTPSPTATPLPTATPSPTALASVPTTCQFPADTTTFHLTMTFGASPNIGWGTFFGTMGGGGGGVSGGLLDLFGNASEDATMEFSYVAPDRWSVVVSVGSKECGSYVVIGSQAWYKDAESTEWTEEPASDEFASFSPQDFCEVVQGLPLSMELAGEEAVNGVETVHYQISEETSMYEWLVGEVSPEYSYDVWLAENGNWPVKLIYDAECEMSWEISDLNDPSIVVEAPTLR